MNEENKIKTGRNAAPCRNGGGRTGKTITDGVFKKTPSVSVIMPAYLAADFIGAALESVFNQTFADYEVIVVNDGSPDTDELERVLESWQERIVYIKQANSGCSAARNRALSVARGCWVAFLDADDYWEPEYLAEQLAFLDNHPSVDLVYTDALLVGESPLAGKTFMRTSPSSGDVTLEALLAARCTVLLSGTLVRRQAILDAGLFDESLRCSEDYDLWLRMVMNRARLAYQRKVLLCKRIHPVSLSSNHINLHEHTLRVLRKTNVGRLSANEREALYEQETNLQATVKLERAKQRLIARDFAGAADDIRNANRVFKSRKLRLMLRWLQLLPGVLVHIYKLRSHLINDRSSGAAEASSLTIRAGWLFFAKCVAFCLSFALPLLLVRQLSQHEFGLYKQVFLVVGTAIYILPLGFGMSAFYFLPRERERRDQVVFNILLFYTVMGLGAFIALTLRPSLLSMVFNSTDIEAYAPQIGLMILLLVMSSFLEVVALANQESRIATFFIILFQLIKTGLMLTAAILLASVQAIISAAIVYGILQTAALLLYLRSRFGVFWKRINWQMIRIQTAYALPLGVAGVLFQVQADLHNYFVSYRFSTAEFAVYAVGCFNLPLIGMLSESAGSVTIPRVSYLQKNGHHHQIVGLIARMSRKLAAVYFPIYFFLLVMCREFITVLFTTRYESSWPIFAINLTMIPLGLLACSCDPVLRAYAEHRFFLMKVRVGVIFMLSVALWFGTSRFGLIGAITVVVILNLIERVLIGARVARILGITRRDIVLFQDTGKLAIASLTAAIAIWILRSYWFESTPFSLLILCGIVFCIVYAIALFALGVLNEEERDFISSRFARLAQNTWRPQGAGFAAHEELAGVGCGVWNAPAVATVPGHDSNPDFSRHPSAAIEVGELSDRGYWDFTHDTENEFWERKNDLRKSTGTEGFTDRIKILIKAMLGSKILEYMRSYDDYLLWNVIYKKYLPNTRGARVLEVGSAPGDYLVRLSKTFHCIPFGIEYSNSGVELNRRLFIANNIDPNNVIHGDFLSEEFHKRYQGQFELVTSRGFIEHFTDAKGIVERHLNLLADDGVLVISVPNLRGLNYLFARLFHKELIAMHNLTIMGKSKFKELFDDSEVSEIFCGYYGTFNFGLFNARENSVRQSILSLCMKFQMLLNLAFRLLLRDRGAESAFLSPSLIFVGKKKRKIDAELLHGVLK